MSDVFNKCHRCQTPEKGLRRCTGCYTVYYCSKQCQRSDWDTHKTTCQKTTKGSSLSDTATRTAIQIKQVFGTASEKTDGNEDEEINMNEDSVTNYSEKAGDHVHSMLDMYPKCHHCQTYAENLRSCTGCYTVYYCSKQCQRSDWTSHKMACRGSAIESAIHSTSMTTSTYGGMNTDNASPTFKAANPRNFELHGNRQTSDFMATSNSEKTENEASRDKPAKKFKGKCMACSKICTMMCAECKVVVYCSMACQKEDWLTHKQYCKKDIKDSITHVEFYLDHLGDNPLPKFSYADVTPGNYILIQNPLMHQFMDGQVGLRIDDPSEVHICSIERLPK